MTDRFKACSKRWDVFDVTTSTEQGQLLAGVAPDAIEIAHAVDLQTVCELTGLTAQWIKDHGGSDPGGELAVACFSLDGECQDLFIRRTEEP